MKNKMYLNEMYLNVTITLLFACLMASTSFAQLTSDNGYIFLRDQGLYGDNNSSLFWRGNNNSITQFILEDKQGTRYGKVAGAGNGTHFGLMDGNNNWTFVAKKNDWTGLRVNNSEKMRILANGNVGVGTLVPEVRFHSAGVIRASNAYNNLGEFIEMGHGGSNSYINHKGDGRIDFRFDGNNKMVLTSTARLGIGVDNPQANLHIRGGCRSAKWDDATQYMTFHQGGFNKFGTGGIYFQMNGQNVFTIANNGNAGIGTASPDNKLDVKGTIRAEEVKVELGWSDYVFYDDYQLPTLEEEEEHIWENGHLLGFESEKAMEN